MTTLSGAGTLVRSTAASGVGSPPTRLLLMPTTVTLDAMIPREDFYVQTDSNAQEQFQEFTLEKILTTASLLRILRKPDFQRETNHWTPQQIASFIESFVDNEIIPGLIMWDSKSYVFIIDGGHRLSALRAWIEDDYGDKLVSRGFYGKDNISNHQLKAAQMARKQVEARVGRFADLTKMVGTKEGTEQQLRRANRLSTRRIPVQWIQGNAMVAEASFFKINRQGTPLDDVEARLIQNREKPIAIAARSILRAGSGHKYWRRFSAENSATLEDTAKLLYQRLFEPEVDEPLKTLDVPIGGTVSPVDAIALLIEILEIAGTRDGAPKKVEEYAD